MVISVLAAKLHSELIARPSPVAACCVREV